MINRMLGSRSLTKEIINVVNSKQSSVVINRITFHFFDLVMVRIIHPLSNMKIDEY